MEPTITSFYGTKRWDFFICCWTGIKLAYYATLYYGTMFLHVGLRVMSLINIQFWILFYKRNSWSGNIVLSVFVSLKLSLYISAEQKTAFCRQYRPNVTVMYYIMYGTCTIGIVCLLYVVCASICMVQACCVLSTATCRQHWTLMRRQFTCINVTRWHSEICSRSSLWQIVQSKPLRRCWTSSTNSLKLSTCHCLMPWNKPGNIMSIADWSKTDT